MYRYITAQGVYGWLGISSEPKWRSDHLWRLLGALQRYVNWCSTYQPINRYIRQLQYLTARLIDMYTLFLTRTSYHRPSHIHPSTLHIPHTYPPSRIYTHLLTYILTHMYSRAQVWVHQLTTMIISSSWFAMHGVLREVKARLLTQRIDGC